jgi:hypothetical protein
MLKKLLDLLCRHTRSCFIRNIYGDEILHRNGHRSMWVCLDCGAHFTKKDLHDNVSIK